MEQINTTHTRFSSNSPIEGLQASFALRRYHNYCILFSIIALIRSAAFSHIFWKFIVVFHIVCIGLNRQSVFIAVASCASNCSRVCG